MYRTPMRRGLSPDSPVRYRDSPVSREGRSWSRGQSPPRKRSSPNRHGRSPDRRGRSRSRHRSRSRQGGHARSRSRGRPGRSRSRPRRSRSRPRRSRSPPSRRSRSPTSRPRRSQSPSSRPRRSPSPSSRRSPSPSSRPRRSPSPPSRSRRSPSPYSRYRRRSPGEIYRYDSQRRPSPSYRSNRTPDKQPLSSPHESDRSSSAKPLPKSILKKRMDVEPTSRDQSPQVDNFSSNKDVRPVGAGKSAEKNNLTENLKSSASNSSAPTAAQTPESPLLHDSAQHIGAETNWTLSGSMDIGMKDSDAGQTSLCKQTETPNISSYSSTVGNLFNQSSTKSETIPFSSMNVFTDHKERVQKDAGEAGDFFLTHEQECKLSSLPSKTLNPKQRSSDEIEDEERFLYGYEEEKKPEPQNAPSVQTALDPPAKGSPNKQEFEKIHDLLKTIGLDIGVAEIGKLAVRTQERLHGKKLAPKPATKKPQNVATTGSDEPKTKVPEPQVKTEKKEEAELSMKTKPAVKSAPKEPTPSVTPVSPAPPPKEKPQLILLKPLPKETPPAPKETPPAPKETPPAPKEQPQAPKEPPQVPKETPPAPKETPPVPKVEIPVQTPTANPAPNPTPPPVSPSQIPVYPQYSHSQMVPGYNMPPPNYNPYTPYVSYPTSSWTMYPPMPPQPSPVHLPTPPVPHMNVPVSAPAPVYMSRNLRIIETTENLPEAKAAIKPDTKPTSPLAELLAQKEADRKNKENEKLKVLEELDFVRKEHKLKSESLKTLSTKVEQLRVQQGILLRKKRREKDGHKDPLLEELNNVLESAQKQINSLCEEIDTTKQKQQQLTKVAEILGVNPTELAEKREPKKERSPGSPVPTRDSENESRTSSDSSKSAANDLKTSSDPVFKTDAKAKNGFKSGADTKSLEAAQQTSIFKPEDEKCKGTPTLQGLDPKGFRESQPPLLSKSEDNIKPREKSRSKSPPPCTPPTKTPPKSEEPPFFELSNIFEYYDSGSHWCEDCNAICITLPEFLLHLHDKKHNQCVKEVKRPWVKKEVEEPTNKFKWAKKKQKVTLPLKGEDILRTLTAEYMRHAQSHFTALSHVAGPEFLVPVNGYYCELCEELFADHVAAEKHLRAYAHNDKYKKHTDANLNYEAVRREKKKTKLMAAQEASRKQAEQKRKIAEQKREAQEHSKAKKAKKEDQEEERKAKSKRRSSASPPPSHHKQKKTPEKEPPKNPSFGKFVWKSVESKTTAAVSSSKVEAAPNKPKEEEHKTLSLKPKGFAIKLLGKPSTLPGNALSPSHSAAPTTVTSTASSTSVASSSPAISTPQTKVRPNLPSVMNVRVATPQVTMSKPAPLNTFLSIRSPDSASRSIPILKNQSTDVFSQDLVSKAFAGEVVVLKESAQPNLTNKTDNEPEKITDQGLQSVQTVKKQDYLFNVLIPKKETVEKKVVKSEKGGAASKKPMVLSPQKSGPVPTSTSHTTVSVPTKPSPNPGYNVQQTSTTKPPVLNPSPDSSTSVNSSISSANSSSNISKTDSTINPSNQQTGNTEVTPKREESKVQQPQEAKAPCKEEKEAPKEVKASTFSMNPVTGRLEYLPVQKAKSEDTHVKKLLEPKLVPTPITYISSVKPRSPVSTPLMPLLKTKPTFNATTKLNQKFKKAPLSLPSSLFGHVQDAGCKDIKITSLESQRNNIKAVKSETTVSPVHKNMPSVSSATPSPANPSSMQQEIDSYYKLIATEEDPEDLITSEDQDTEVVSPANVTTAPLKPKVESRPEKKVKLESAPPVRAPIRPVIPDVSGEDIDDSDMACEVPDVPLSSAPHISGWNFMQSSYASSKFHGSSNRQPSNLAFGNISVNKNQPKETQVATPETSMEDLSVYVTCDSD